MKLIYVKASSQLNYGVKCEVEFSYRPNLLHRTGIGHCAGNYHVDIVNRQYRRLFRQTNEFARNTLHTNIMS